MKVLVTGGTGFVGRQIVDGLLAAGHLPRCLVRSAEKGQELVAAGAELALGDVTDLASITAAAAGMDAAVHLVGIIRETRTATFHSVHVEGTRNVTLALREHGVDRLLHMSALGTRPNAVSHYHQSKWRAEEAVTDSRLRFTIFRPSVIFGKGDGFTTSVVHLVRRAPVVPIIGTGTARFQPISVEDVAGCFVASLDDDDTVGQTYELCGPEILTFPAYVDLVMSALGIRKRTARIPAALMKALVGVSEQFIPNLPITSDQLVMSQEDGLCSDNAAISHFRRRLRKLSDAITDIV